ncbi:hypothetical protein HNR37_001774, partial [Desulfurispira natronophila]
DPDPTDNGNNNGGQVTLTSIDGKVLLDDAVEAANVCLDLNRNGLCDTDEPSATTDADGSYSLDVADIDNPETYPLVAELATASGAVAIAGEAGMIRAASSSDMERLLTPAGKTIISPLTTMIQSEIMQNPHRNSSHIATELRVHLGLADDKDLFGDVSADPELKKVAAVINRTAAAVRTSIESTTGIATTGFETAILALVTNIVMENLDKVKEELAKETPDAPTLSVTTTNDEIAAIGGTVTDSSSSQGLTVKALADGNETLRVIHISGNGTISVYRQAFKSSGCEDSNYCFSSDSDEGTTAPAGTDGDSLTFGGAFSLDQAAVYPLTGQTLPIRALVSPATVLEKVGEVTGNCSDANNCTALDTLNSKLDTEITFTDNDKRYTIGGRSLHIDFLSDDQRNIYLGALRGKIQDSGYTIDDCQGDLSSVNWNDLFDSSGLEFNAKLENFQWAQAGETFYMLNEVMGDGTVYPMLGAFDNATCKTDFQSMGLRPWNNWTLYLLNGSAANKVNNALASN